MATAAVEQYTGEGEPPYCKMTLQAIDSDTTLNANFIVTLNGAQPPNNTITVTTHIKLLSRTECKFQFPPFGSIFKIEHLTDTLDAII